MYDTSLEWYLFILSLIVETIIPAIGMFLNARDVCNKPFTK